MGTNGNGFTGLSLGDALMSAKVVQSGQNKKAAKRQEVKKGPTGAMTDSSGAQVVTSSAPVVGGVQKFNFSALKVQRRFIPTPEEVRAIHEKEQAKEQAKEQEAQDKHQKVLDFCQFIGPYMHDRIGQAWEIIQAPEKDAYLYAEGK